MKSMGVALGLGAVLLAIAGCTVTRDVKTYEQLQKASQKTLRLLAVDRSVYELTVHMATDSTIEGSGVHLVNGDRIPFSGRLAYRDLVYIQVRATGYWRTLSALGFIGASALVVISAATDETGLSVYRPSESSSCPYVYAWNGEAYALEGEAFGTSFGKGLEARTICMLPRARPRDGEILVRVANERPETHYVNRAALLAFEAPAGAEVLLDDRNRAWPLVAPAAPVSGPSEVGQRDGSYWVRSVREPGTATRYRDSLCVSFARPAGARDASLVVRAINTDLVYAAFRLVFGYLGDQALPFLYQVETDPELIRVLKGWIEDCSLQVEFEEQGRWVSAGAIAPEASACVFSRIVRMETSGIEGDRLRIRLNSLADVWRIDAVEIDWTEVAPLEAHPLSLRAARDGGGSSMMEALTATDARYAILLPGEEVRMAFEAHRTSGPGTVAYALEAGGYLHEWPPDSEAEADAVSTSGSERLAIVNGLVRNRELLLPLIYSSWRHREQGQPGVPRWTP